MDLGLPVAADLAAVLGSEVGERAIALIDKRLVQPARDLLARPSKHMRSGLLKLAYELAGGDPQQDALANRAAEAMELLHMGSLIVDDIEDGSPQRRGDLSLHLIYGLPSALCTGNWLYLWPMRLLAELPMPPDTSYLILRHYHSALELAHYGQALALSVKIDTLPQTEVASVCEAVVKLKTGTVTALAMRLGAILAGADDVLSDALADFGMKFGMALQNFDDLGNLAARCEPSKRCEDLRQRKPTAVWSIVARHANAADFADFRRLAMAAGDDPEPVLAWLVDHDVIATTRREIDSATAAAFANLEDALARCRSRLEQRGTRSPVPMSNMTNALQQLRALAETLRHAY